MDDLATRLLNLIKTAEEIATRDLESGRGLGAWSNIISLICPKVASYGSLHMSRADSVRAIEFLNLPLFGELVEVVRLSGGPDPSTRQAVKQALDSWESAVITLLENLPVSTEPGLLGMTGLLMLREGRSEFEHVNKILNSIVGADLGVPTLRMVNDCIYPCLRWQDLDGVEALAYKGLTIAVKSSPDLITTYLIQLFDSFLNASELNLGVSVINNSLRRLQTSDRSMPEQALRVVLNSLNESLTAAFDELPLPPFSFNDI